ncbi:hypothetical protein Patl1_36872 [Pistacia atlantica]|nr:hypothetical protein Patl1_36872 [Pistacia atlantica]
MAFFVYYILKTFGHIIDKFSRKILNYFLASYQKIMKIGF